MIRENIFSGYSLDPHLKLRGKEVTRLEGLSDGIFSLAIALLVVSSQVPGNFKELLGFMEDFVAFFLCMLMIISIWKSHNEFFLQYGLRDKYCIKINTVLLFLVLFYVYPLKFLFKFALKEFYYELLYNFVSKSYGKDFSNFFNQTIHLDQISLLIVIFTLGLALIHICFILLNKHAYKNSQMLTLNNYEIFNLNTNQNRHYVVLLACILSIIISSIAFFSRKPHINTFAGLIYLIIPIQRKISKKNITKVKFELL